MNASGGPNTCKSNGVAIHSGRRVRNAYATYLLSGDNISKEVLIPRKIVVGHPTAIKLSGIEDGHASD
jgi:hypothetical protein